MCSRVCGAALVLAAALSAQSPKYRVGHTPSPEEIKAWDISILPDGTGLPEGKGTAVEGRELYARRCQKCHGAKGEGGDYEQPIVGGKDSLKTPKPLKTVGSYWPYATTLWDYINRAMPFDTPETLTHDQVYAASAFVLYLNGIVGEKDVLDAKTLPQIKMPNRDGFTKDPRPDIPVVPRRVKKGS
jgi:mono/diheme cytochrome c family protein